MHFQLRCRSPNVQTNTRPMIAEGLNERDQDGFFRMRPMSFNASGRAALSAAAQAPYITTASVAAPAGIPNPDARSLTQGMWRIPLNYHNALGTGWGKADFSVDRPYFL